MTGHPDQTAIDLFWANGFARFEDIFDPALLKAADDEFVRLADLKGVEGLTVLDKGVASGRPSEERLVRVENPQIASDAYKELISNRELGRIVAELFSAEMVQVFFAHVTSLPAVDSDNVRIGWHQEEQYPDFITGCFPTVWVPLCDINETNGPLRYIPESHRYGVFPDRGITSPLSHEEQQAGLIGCLGLESWREVPMTGRRGMCTVHHSRLVHGTRPNRSDHPRRALVMHLRTDLNILGRSANSLYDMYSNRLIRDDLMSPVIWGERLAELD